MWLGVKSAQVFDVERLNNMTKLDLLQLTAASDALLDTTENPLHRQILEVYRRHVLLEVTGRWEEIFAPDMTVEHPIYRVNAALSLSETGATEVLEGEEVRAFYKMLTANGAPIMTTEGEKLAVADWGFACESLFYQQVPGAALQRAGVEIDDPEAVYVQKFYMVAVWHHDRRGRLIGEHLYEAKPGSREVIKLKSDDVISQQEALDLLTPLIRPLPVFEAARV
jgi:hypothetical protein